MATIRELVAQRNSIQQQLFELQSQLFVAQEAAPQTVTTIQAQIVQLQQRLQEIEIQIQQLSAPTASAGNLVSDDARATVDESVVQNPDTAPLLLNNQGRIVEAADTNTSTNAVPAVSLDNEEFGLNDPVRSITDTQSVSLGNEEQGGPLLLNAEVDGREEPVVSTSVGGLPGAGSAPDDNFNLGGTGTDTGVNQTRVEIDNAFNEEKIIPQPNVLDQYASYTYVASLYLMSQQDYREMIRTKQKTLRGAQLLIQSGGAPVGGRNEYFSNDYYIDKIELTSKITGKGTNAAHNVNTIKMTVIEPNGITLIGNLDRAVQAYLGSVAEKKRNFTAQMYLLVIRFYGYDAQGNLVRGGVARPDGSSDPNAFIEKWYPMAISNIDFKVANKLVEYNIVATSPSYAVAASSNRGTIPYNIELSGVTVKDVLSGPAQYVTNTLTGGIDVDDQGVPLLPADQGFGGVEAQVNTAPPNASAAPSKKTTIRQGLMAALNEYQRQLVNEGIYTYPDTYSIEFVNSSLEQAAIKNKGSTDKSKISNASAQSAVDKKDPRKQSADTNSKIATITAGSQIVQVIDQVVRNSSYLEDQQIVIFDPNSQQEKPNGAPAKNLAYFKIGLQATPTKYDPKRNDYAYDIKYIVNIYRINESASNYFFVPTFKGVHKQYNYWFTGQNNSVLNYEQSYNAFYTSVLSGGKSSPATVYNDAIRFNFQPRSAESSQGADGKVNEPKANLADFLFNPGDLANATLSIVGDPAWLQQSEAFAGIRKNDPYFFRSFLADGTINFESQQILFEVLINSPRDYNLSTGLSDPNEQTTYFQNGRQPGAARQSYVYQAQECVSEFNRGKFTQTLKGTLLTFYPDQTFKANQQIAAELQNDILRSLSDNRQNLSGLVGSILSPSFINNLPTVASLTNQAGTGFNQINTNPGSTNYGILGASPTRISADPTDPTSFGLSIGGVNLNSINAGTSNAPGIGTPSFVGGATASTAGTTTGPAQQMAESDDAGGTEILEARGRINQDPDIG